MTPHVLTLNAGSSSIKFALVDAGGERLAMRVVGRIEGLGGHPKLHVDDPEGIRRADRELSPSEARDHEAALATILQYLRRTSSPKPASPRSGTGWCTAVSGSTERS